MTVLLAKSAGFCYGVKPGGGAGGRRPPGGDRRMLACWET